MKICLFGASSSRLDPVYFQESEKMGRLIAEAGHTVVFGGGADGLMGACARGAKAAGGKIVGIAPRMFNEPGILLPKCDELILTDTMAARKEIMFSESEAFLALPGGIGTPRRLSRADGGAGLYEPQLPETGAPVRHAGSRAGSAPDPGRPGGEHPPSGGLYPLT